MFGSGVTGGAGENSDVDSLASMAPGATVIELIGLKQDLAARLGREIDVVSDDAINPMMRDEVCSNAVVL